MSRNCWVSVMTRLRVGRPRFDSWQEQWSFCLLPRPHRLWVPPSLLSDKYRGNFPGGRGFRAWSWPLTHLHPRSGKVKIHVCSIQSGDTRWHLQSVGIALGYGLDERASRVRFPAGAGNFSHHHRIQNGSGAHPASYPMGTRCFLPGAGAWSWPLTSI
jgi:hypothetical protein